MADSSPMPKVKTVPERLATLETSFDSFKADVHEKLEGISVALKEFAQNSKSDRRYGMQFAWPVGGAIVALLTFYVTSQLTPLRESDKAQGTALEIISKTLQALENGQSTLKEQSSASIKEREGLLRVQNDNVIRLGSMERDHASLTATYDSRLAEIETQIAAVENVNSAMHWHQEVMNSILSQNKDFTYPLLPMPVMSISNRKPLVGGGK